MWQLELAGCSRGVAAMRLEGAIFSAIRSRRRTHFARRPPTRLNGLYLLDRAYPSETTLTLLYLNQRDAIDAALGDYEIPVVIGHHVAHDAAA